MEQREKGMKINGQSLRNLWENIKRSNNQVISLREERMRQEYIFEDLMA